ncbi:MAG: hypothetical protein VYD50_02915 [Candidatus Thermoplasmatota archaeon]|nr:hypothetical protein [Candidatus Thermoplasmatota archaeon]
MERNGESQDGKRRTRRGRRLPWRKRMRRGENWRGLDRTGRKDGEVNGGKQLGNEGGETRGEARIESWKGMSRGWNRSGDGEGGSDFSVVGK